MKTNWTIERITPAVDDRAVIIGQTGVGKTFLAEYLLQRRPRVWVFDWKGFIKWKKYQVVRSIKDLLETDYPYVIFKVRETELEDFDLFNHFFKAAFLTGDLTVYVDEVTGVTKNQVIPRYYKALLVQGRERGIGVISSTQRPSFIPGFVMSETEHSFIFYLKMGGDKEKVEEMTGIAEERIAALPKRHFIYSDNFRTSPPITLKLSNQGRFSNAESR